MMRVEANSKDNKKIFKHIKTQVKTIRFLQQWTVKTGNRIVPEEKRPVTQAISCEYDLEHHTLLIEFKLAIEVKTNWRNEEYRNPSKTNQAYNINHRQLKSNNNKNKWSHWRNTNLVNNIALEGNIMAMGINATMHYPYKS